MCLQMERSEIPHDPRHLGVPSGASKMIFESMVRSTQTEHLSCIKISTIRKQSKMSFLSCLVTLEYDRVHPKWFLSQWCVWRKPSTYLAPALTLCPNRKKWCPTRPTSLRSCDGCVKNNFQAYGTFNTNSALSCVKITTLSERTNMSFPLSLVTLWHHPVCPKWFLSLWYD
jgi:hypothetical protein